MPGRWKSGFIETKRRSGKALRCSFCGKTREQVEQLIAGPGVFICNECVELCNEILAERRPRSD